MLQHFGPMMNKGGASISLTYLASERIVPGGLLALVAPVLGQRAAPHWET